MTVAMTVAMNETKNINLVKPPKSWKINLFKDVTVSSLFILRNGSWRAVNATTGLHNRTVAGRVFN